jgi:hypothetical protein
MEILQSIHMANHHLQFYQVTPQIDYYLENFLNTKLHSLKGLSKNLMIHSQLANLKYLGQETLDV